MALITPNIFSLQGKGLKLDSRSDMDQWLKDIDPAVIEEVHFGGNTIGVDAAEALAEFLRKATAIKVMNGLSYLVHAWGLTLHFLRQIANFADVFTGRLISEIPLALTAICDALKDKTSLVEINLSDNAFGGRSVDPIVPFLTHNRSFQVLKLNNNGLGPAGGAILATALLESAKLSSQEGKPSNLRTVICGRNRLEDGSASVWAEAFAAHGTLREVRMPQNGIRIDGITALAKGLAKCGMLQHIDLQDNTFTADGATTGVQTWADALHSWPELKTLNLSDCVLSGDGEVPSIVKVLAGGSNPLLGALDLQNNNLESQTLALLSDAISTHLRNVKTLALQWNEFDEEEDALEDLRGVLKARGGKLFVTEDDEEQEEQTDEETEGREETEDTVDDLAKVFARTAISEN
jgi:Ran GTPase-activating protein 1